MWARARGRGGGRGARVRAAAAGAGGGGAGARVRGGGAAGFEASACCLGTMTFGQQNTEAEAHQLLSHAFENGVDFFDTAEMYPVPAKRETAGSTDRYVGSWLKTKPRESVKLATKVAGFSEGLSYLRRDGRACRLDAQSIRESVEDSLKRLGTDHIDLLQLHWPDRYVPLFGQARYEPEAEREAVPFEEQLQALDELVQAGKVLHVGVSNETSYGVSEFVKLADLGGLPRIRSIQNVYSLLCRVRYETDLAEMCRQHDVGLLAYSPLGGGILSGKYIGRDGVEGARLSLFDGYMERYKGSDSARAVEKYAEVAKRHGLSLTELSLAWCQAQWCVTSSIIGATSLPQLEENLRAFDVCLPPECLAEVEAIHKAQPDPAML